MSGRTAFSFEHAIQQAVERGVAAAMDLRAKRLLKVKEAAEYIALSPREVYNLITNGELPVVKHGKCTMLDIRDLDSWIERKKQG